HYADHHAADGDRHAHHNHRSGVRNRHRRRVDPIAGREVIERRIGLLFASFLLLLVLGIGRAAWVQGVQGGGLTADAQSQQMETVPVPGLRGSILDRKGRELAVSEDAVDVIATPYQVKDPPQMARKLAPILHISQHDILKNLDSGSSGFDYLARDADLTAAGRIRKLGLTGVTTVPASRGGYPGGRAARPGT